MRGHNLLIFKFGFSSLKEYETEKNQIIHLRAIEVYKTEFMDFQDYLEFHNKGVQYVFIDTPDEVLFQQQERAVAIINQEAHLMGLETAKEIIEDIVLREKYKKKLQIELQISKRKAERLYRYVKRCIMGK